MHSAVYVFRLFRIQSALIRKSRQSVAFLGAPELEELIRRILRLLGTEPIEHELLY